MSATVKYRTVADYFQEVLGCKVRKIAVNARLGCPGRCAYCNNEAFSPKYSIAGGSITEQITNGLEFNSAKGPADAILVYFQSYTNTHGDSAHLIELYEEALRYPGVAGLVIATRPDCLPEALLDWFQHRFGNLAPEGHPYLLVEIGVESTDDHTLADIRRGHSWECSRSAIVELDRRGIAVGAHIIIGLPGEDDASFLEHARRLAPLPISTLKLHQLQIIRGTEFEMRYRRSPGDFNLPTARQYAQTVAAFLQELDNVRSEEASRQLSWLGPVAARGHVNGRGPQAERSGRDEPKAKVSGHEQLTATPSQAKVSGSEHLAATPSQAMGPVAIDRFVSEAPQDMVIAPRWGLKPSEFAELLRNS